jgi:hypothetical protein
MDTTNSDQVHTQGFRSNRTQLQEYNYHKEIKDHDNNKFNYRQVIGKMLYLEKSTRPDISCAVHQFARFSANPKNKHAEAAKRIGRYLLGTQEKDLVMKPNQNGLECWVDIMCIRMGQQDSSK